MCASGLSSCVGDILEDCTYKPNPDPAKSGEFSDEHTLYQPSLSLPLPLPLSLSLSYTISLVI